LGTPFFGVPNGPFCVSDALTDYVEVLAQQTISEQARAGGSFAPARQVAETAGSLERLVAFTGRAVHAGAWKN